MDNEEKILNCGCGKDAFGTHFIDKYPKRKGVKEWDADKDKIPFPDNTFDVVYSKNLFEHLSEPMHFLTECHRVLKNGGKIVLITDNACCWYYSFNLHKHVKKYGADDRHYLLVSENHLKNWFSKAGFKISNVGYIRDSYKLANPFLKPIKMIGNFLLPKRISSVRIKIEGNKCR